MSVAPLPVECRAYQPRGAARDLFHCRAGEVLIEGPAGTGKTRAVLEKMHYCAYRYPGMRGLFVRKSRTSCTQSILVTFEQDVVEVGAGILRGPDRTYRVSYRYDNGSEIVIGGMDDSDRIMSSEYDLIGVFEATELFEADFEKLKSRLRHGMLPYQQIIADCNPQAPTHWMNQRAGTDKMTRLLSRHEDNPKVTAEYLELLNGLTGVRRERLYLGRWVAAEGVVYPEFDRRLHVIERFPVPTDWRRFRAVDFGFTNPFVCQWWAVDPDGRLYLYREIYTTRRTVNDHAPLITRLSAGDGQIEATVSDHDAEDRETLHQLGIQTLAARKEIMPGLQAVGNRLRCSGDGRPRLFLFADALVERDEALAAARKPICTLDEFDCYIWPKSADGRPIKEVPVKEHDHGLDALRYMVRHLDGGGMLDVRITTTDPRSVQERDWDE